MRPSKLGCLCVLLAAASSTAAAQTLQAPPIVPPGRCSIVQVFGDAAVRNVISDPGDKTSTTGLLGMRYFGPHWIAIGSISIAGQTDTLRTGLGASLLPPSSGKSLNAGLIDIRRRSLPFLRDEAYARRVGFHSYGSASSTLWGFRDATRTEAFEVPIWGAGYGLYYQFFGGMINDTNQVSMSFEAGVAHRHLRGDLFSPGRDSAQMRSRRAIRDTLIGTTKRNFRGLEFGLNLNYRDIHGGLTYYFFPGRLGRSVDGLTGGQVVAGVSIQPTIASDWLKNGLTGNKKPDATSPGACAQLAQEARTGFVAPAPAKKPASDSAQRADSTARRDTTARPDTTMLTMAGDASVRASSLSSSFQSTSVAADRWFDRRTAAPNRVFLNTVAALLEKRGEPSSPHEE